MLSDDTNVTFKLNGDVQGNIGTLRDAVEFLEDGAMNGDRIEIQIANDEERLRPAYTCAVCVRGGARDIQVHRSAAGIAEHLFVEHNINIASLIRKVPS